MPPRFSQGAKNMNYQIRKGDGTRFALKDVFTTAYGSWEPSNREFSIEQWAFDSYARPFGAADWFDDAGGEQHLFIRVEDTHGNALPVDVLFWSEEDGNGNPTNAIRKNTREKRSGWQNQDIYNSFAPNRGEVGAWRFAPVGARDILIGGGLPLRQHISTFAVWQEVGDQDQPIDPDPKDPADDNESPVDNHATEGLTVTSVSIAVRLSDGTILSGDLIRE